MDLLLTLSGIAALVALVDVLGLQLLAFAGSTLAGRIIEAIFDFLVPAGPSRIGSRGMIGRSARAVSTFVPTPNASGREGTVRVSGELWNARSESDMDVPMGARVRIVAIDELVVLVEREVDGDGSRRASTHRGE